MIIRTYIEIVNHKLYLFSTTGKIKRGWYWIYLLWSSKSDSYICL